MGDDPDPLGADVSCHAHPLRSVLREDHQHVHALEEPSQPCRGTTADTLPAQPPVRGEDTRPAGRQEEGIEARNRQPLIVDDVSVAAAPTVALHGPPVLDDPARTARTWATAAGATVEVLGHPIAPGEGHLAVSKRARHQLDLGPGPDESLAERAGVGGGVGGWVDEFDAHR
jgi:hypothetical protein